MGRAVVLVGLAGCIGGGWLAAARRGQTPAPGMSSSRPAARNPSSSRDKSNFPPKTFSKRRVRRGEPGFPYGSKIFRMMIRRGTGGQSGLASGKELYDAAKRNGSGAAFSSCHALADGLRCPCTRGEACSDSPYRDKRIEKLAEEAARKTSADLCAAGKVPADMRSIECGEAK